MTRFAACRFADLEGWDDTGHFDALKAFRRSAPALLDGSIRSGSLGIAADAYRPAAEAVLAETGIAEDPRRFFEERFVPLLILPDEERSGPQSGDGPATGRDYPGFLTGYYEPVVDASPVRTARFRYPLYSKPDDLVAIDDVSRPPGMEASFRFARRTESGFLTEYYDRAAIEAGALDGRGLELAFLADPVDVFFIHVQGSARLSYPDGRQVRVGYAAKSGHPFTAIGRLLVDDGELTLAEADMAGIRGWLESHPNRRRALLDRNRSFIFFTSRPVEKAALGPVGAANVPLTPLASIAVDRDLATFGVPYFVAAPTLSIGDRPFRRLTIAQDTGSAILGAARADLFVGSGDEAGAIAGRVRHKADFHLLVPPGLAERLVR